MAPAKPRIGIRAKLLLASSVLLLIPWLGYRFIADMELFLRSGQQQALADKALLMATLLRERPTLLRARDAGESAELVPALQQPIQLDGDIGDWLAQGADVRAYGAEHLTSQDGGWSAQSLSFSHALGRYHARLYAFFEVTDEHVVHCPAGEAGRACDHLRITLPGGAQYAVSAPASGALAAVPLADTTHTAGLPSVHISGVWRDTPRGYVIELQLAGVAGRPGFAVVDIDDPARRQPAAVMATAAALGAPAPAAALIAAPELQQLAADVASTHARIWIIDRHKRVVLRAEGTRSDAAMDGQPPDLLQALEERLLRPLYRRILPEPGSAVSAPDAGADTLDGPEVERALAGMAESGLRHGSGPDAAVITAAHPVLMDERIAGAVVVEQTTRVIGDLRRRALERLLTLTLGAFVLAALVLLLFASRLSSRIRRLRDAAERSIDPAGRVQHDGCALSGATAGDELGDLSRSLSQMLERLAQHTGYLENMARRLGHELRTPIGVVRSSLDNLRMQALPQPAQVYLERADSGLTRLSTILSRMSEATRLEQIMQHAQREQFDLRAVVAGCIEGYRGVYASCDFRFKAPSSPLAVSGVPDLIAQLLDKLVENAVDFSAGDAPIDIELRADAAGVELAVRNEGPPLPPGMADRLFESMVSVRGDTADAAPHLGLGLYIVNLVARFHYGRACARNRDDGRGVEVSVRLPRYVSNPA